MDMDRDEQVIFLKDLLFAVLYQWKKILLAALAFAVLLGGYAAAKNVGNVPSEQAEQQYQKDLEQYQIEKAALEQNIESTEQKIRAQQEYMENSLLMQLDPYAFFEGTMQLCIATDYQIQPGMAYQNPDYTKSVLSAYQAMLGGEYLLSQIAQQTGEEQKYLAEIVTVALDGNSVNVRIRCQDQDLAEDILEMIEQQLDQMGQKITQSVGNHTANLVTKGCNNQMDLTLVDEQQQTADRLTSLTTTLEQDYESLNALQKPSKAAASKKNLVKYAVLGAAVGVFLMAAAACVCHVVSGKVYSVRTLEARTPVRVIGRLPEKQTRGIDRWLRKLEGRIVAHDETAAQVVCATVRNYCGAGMRLLLTGDLDAGEIRTLTQGLEMKDVTVTACGSLLADPAAEEELAVCDGVLLVEKCGSSRYENISRAIVHIHRMDKKLIGCLLFE